MPHTARKDSKLYHKDRPGWIPEWIGDDWDPNPYAYQTEEQLMPAGHYHSLYIQMLAEMLRPWLEQLGLRLYIDVFLFYRDWEGRKQRIAPDALIAPGREQQSDESPHSYDLDNEPIPRCVVEIGSPSSRVSDLQNKPLYYAALGIGEYVLLDVEDENERLLPQIGIRLWRLEQHVLLPVEPDPEGYLVLTSIGVRLRAEGRRLELRVAETGELLRTSPELTAALAAAETARAAAETARAAAEQRAEEEATARKQAEEELARLRAELAQLKDKS
jgi:Uma2 family endonuclease